MRSYAFPKSSQPIRFTIPPEEATSLEEASGITSMTLNGADFPPGNVYGKVLLPGDILVVTPGADGGSLIGYPDVPHDRSALSVRVRSGVTDLSDNAVNHPGAPYAVRTTFTLPSSQGFQAMYLWGDTRGCTVDLSSVSSGLSAATPAFTLLGAIQDPYGGTVTVYLPNFNALSSGAYHLTVTLGYPTVSELGGTTLGQYEQARIVRATNVSFGKQPTQGAAWTSTPYGPAFQMDRYEPAPLSIRHGSYFRPDVWPKNQPYFDTNLGKPVWLKAAGVWVDATGTQV